MTIDFQLVLAKSPNPYVLLDRRFCIEWANDAYLAATMREFEDIVGRNMFDAFPSEGEPRRQLTKSLERVLETGEADEIAHIQYDIPSSSGGFDVHTWSATNTPILDENERVTHILQHTVRITDIDEVEGPRNAAGVARRAEAVEQRYQGAARQLDRFRAMLEQAPGFVAVLTGRNHRFVLANAAYRQLIGERKLDGRPVSEALPEVEAQGFIDILDRVRETGQPYFGQKERVLLQQKNSNRLEPRFLEFIFQPIHGEDGFRGILVQGYDVTEEVAAEEQQTILINELNHRVKNTLAVVQGIAQQTFRDMSQAQERKAFTDRLNALATAHNHLTARNWETADMESVVREGLEAIAPDDPSRITIEGPSVLLPPQMAVSLAMVIHELGTNAIKYGALSSPDGSVEIFWNTDFQENDTRLTFEWTERGGPAAAAPNRSGFGTRLIGRGLGTPGGSASLDFRPNGLHYQLDTIL